MTRRVLHLREARNVARRALGAGAAMSGPSTVAWDVSSSCSNPRNVAFEGRIDPSEDFRNEKPITTVMTVRCRRCPACLKSRSASWRIRANVELGEAQRTWFGTLTLSEANQVKALYRAQLSAKRRGISWEAPVKRAYGEDAIAYQQRCDLDRFARVVRAIAPEVTKWLKRVRKESGAKLRFLLVAEAHKSGRPHFHILVHESRGSMPIRKRTLDGQWKLGFSQFRLVDVSDKAARYVTKYLTKSVLARVRASIAYGSTASAVASSENDDGVSVKMSPQIGPNQGKVSLPLE